MSKIETIEQRVFRLGRVMHGKDTLSFADALNDRNFKLACKLVELAIAEEREACAKICDEKHWDWSFGSTEEESSISGPKECAELIRQHSASKEVSK